MPGRFVVVEDPLLPIASVVADGHDVLERTFEALADAAVDRRVPERVEAMRVLAKEHFRVELLLLLAMALVLHVARGRIVHRVARRMAIAHCKFE